MIHISTMFEAYGRDMVGNMATHTDIYIYTYIHIYIYIHNCTYMCGPIWYNIFLLCPEIVIDILP